MKHLFIVNPIAGGGKKTAEVTAEIEKKLAASGCEYEIYTTSHRMDATEKVRREAQLGGELRVYACGGDGTLNECVHGAAGFKNASVTNLPCGTGNDFIRMFGDDAPLFADVDALLAGEVKPIDLIDCNGRKCLNICSAGLDARIGSDIHKYSKLPLIGGACGYVVSTVVNLLKGINRPFRVKVGEWSAEGDMAFMCACNGRYYGGGFNPTKYAMIDDGELEFLVVSKVSLLKAMTVIGKYSKGEYEKLPDLVTHIRGRKMEVESDIEFCVQLDGEMISGKKATITIIPGGINFIFPAGMTFFEKEKEKMLAKARE